MHWAHRINYTDTLDVVKDDYLFVILMYGFSTEILRARKEGSVAKTEDS